jgi:hypothetical protein
VSLRVANDDNSLESGTLTGTGLLLDGFDLYFEKKLRSAYQILRQNYSPHHGSLYVTSNEEAKHRSLKR